MDRPEEPQTYENCSLDYSRFDGASMAQDATIPLSSRLREDEDSMKRHLWILSAGIVILLGGITLYAVLHWGGGEDSARESLLATIPSNTQTTIYADFAA